MTREELVAQLTASEKVTFLSPLRDGKSVMLHTRDEELASFLEGKGARVRWFDRVMYSTRKGGEPDMQADVTLGPPFWERLEAVSA